MHFDWSIQQGVLNFRLCDKLGYCLALAKTLAVSMALFVSSALVCGNSFDQKVVQMVGKKPNIISKLFALMSMISV